jgi:hypothetical protein
MISRVILLVVIDDLRSDHVERNWKQYLPFETTSWTWGAE